MPRTNPAIVRSLGTRHVPAPVGTEEQQTVTTSGIGTTLSTRRAK
jgi:hypothetical protein